MFVILRETMLIETNHVLDNETFDYYFVNIFEELSACK